MEFVEECEDGVEGWESGEGFEVLRWRACVDRICAFDCRCYYRFDCVFCEVEGCVGGSVFGYFAREDIGFRLVLDTWWFMVFFDFYGIFRVFGSY